MQTNLGKVITEIQRDAAADQTRIEGRYRSRPRSARRRDYRSACATSRSGRDGAG